MKKERNSQTPRDGQSRELKRTWKAEQHVTRKGVRAIRENWSRSKSRTTRQQRSSTEQKTKWSFAKSTMAGSWLSRPRKENLIGQPSESASSRDLKCEGRFYKTSSQSVGRN